MLIYVIEEDNQDSYDSEGNVREKKMKTQCHYIESSFGERRPKIFKSKKGKNYKEETKEETQEKNKDTYETKVEETLDKYENSATEEYYEAEEYGEDLDKVEQKSHEAHIKVVLGANIKAPKSYITTETQTKAQEIVKNLEESLLLETLAKHIKCL